MNFDEFKKQIHRMFNIDLNSYKENQLRRRIDSFIQKHDAGNYAQFVPRLKSERPLYEAFLDHLTINVSEFFRDPKKFKILETVYLPELLRTRRRLKIWSAACSIGAEPYSVAIVLNEINPRAQHKIIGTDLDKNILARAKQGIFTADAVKNVSPQRLSRYFTKDGGQYLVSPEIKNKVTFRQHDLLLDKYEAGFDLILCRNVTIYFTRDAQDRVNTNLSNSLTNGGILFIGGSEMIFNYRQLGFEKADHSFYRKTNV